jgi:hypothetical protein
LDGLLEMRFQREREREIQISTCQLFKLITIVFLIRRLIQRRPVNSCLERRVRESVCTYILVVSFCAHHPGLGRTKSYAITPVCM